MGISTWRKLLTYFWLFSPQFLTALLCSYLLILLVIDFIYWTCTMCRSLFHVFFIYSVSLSSFPLFSWFYWSYWLLYVLRRSKRSHCHPEQEGNWESAYLAFSASIVEATKKEPWEWVCLLHKPFCCCPTLLICMPFHLSFLSLQIFLKT